MFKLSCRVSKVLTGSTFLSSRQALSCKHTTHCSPPPHRPTPLLLTPITQQHARSQQEVYAGSINHRGNRTKWSLGRLGRSPHSRRGRSFDLVSHKLQCPRSKSDDVVQVWVCRRDTSGCGATVNGARLRVLSWAGYLAQDVPTATPEVKSAVSRRKNSKSRGSATLVGRQRRSIPVSTVSVLSLLAAIIHGQPVLNVIAGVFHTCALLSGGSVQCWGRGQGKAGANDGSLHRVDSAVPVTVPDISTAVALSAGGEHTCALLSGGSVQCWGDNDYGQLGNNCTGNSAVPMAVSGVSTAVAVTAGSAHTCALLSDGSVQCWGDNHSGQLGNSSNRSSAVPVIVAGISAAVAVSAGHYHTCALLQSGSVQCWGDNILLGNNSTAHSESDVRVSVSGVSTAVAVSAGWVHTCVLLSGGSVQCWGRNCDGELGNGNTSRFDRHPVTVSGVSTAVAVAVGIHHTCALLSSGGVQCWGAGHTGGQLASASTARDSAAVSGVSTAIALSAGGHHTCVLLSNGTTQCWGNNYYGQLGNGRISERPPVPNSLMLSGSTMTTSMLPTPPTALRTLAPTDCNRFGIATVGGMLLLAVSATCALSGCWVVPVSTRKPEQALPRKSKSI